MKLLFRYTFALLILVYASMTNAQMTFTLADMTGVGSNQWKYNTVTCTSPNNITSIILSMINNDIASNTSGITPIHTINSLGNNPRTILYLFTPALTPTEVQNFIKGMTFTQTSEIASTNPYVNISVDANPTSLPAGATITVWDDHPDGTPHYYVWVDEGRYLGYVEAYNAAKSYYFQGMRGYLPTITSAAEDATLTNISNLGGWSGGSRTTDIPADVLSLSVPPTSAGSDFKWICGPETNVSYYQGPSYTTSGAGPIDGAYNGWPATGQPDAAGGVNGGENVMQINHTTGFWNDLYAAPDSYAITVLRGYFIEFGGSGKAYTVGTKTYPANPNYVTPTSPTSNTHPQWHEYSPGNTASTSTTFKPNSMRANVLVID